MNKKLRCGLIGMPLGHSYSPEIHALLADYFRSGNTGKEDWR